MSLKDSWKSVGKDFAKLGTDFGKTMVKTVKKGVDKLDEWSQEDEASAAAEAAEPVAEETPKAE